MQNGAAFSPHRATALCPTFIMATMNEKKNISEEKLVSAFKIFDKDNSGTISPEEIREVLGGAAQLSDEVVSSIIK